MLISTIVFNDGEERQVYAQSLTVGEPLKHMVRVELGADEEMLIPITSVKEIVTADLNEDSISGDILGSFSA